MDREFIEHAKLLRAEIAARQTLSEERPRLPCRSAREIKKVCKHHGVVTSETFCDIALRGTRGVENLITKHAITSDRVFGGLGDLAVQFVHPLPRDKFFISTLSAHAS